MIQHILSAKTTYCIIETITGKVSIKQIIKDNREDFVYKNGHLTRQITYNVINKILLCGTGSLGYMKYKCENCGKTKHINFTCKSRFCNSCSKPASDKRINKLFSWRPSNLHYYHLFFTIPEELRNFFKSNRIALNLLSEVGNNILKYFFKKNHNCRPGFVSVIHTFGAQLNRNCHIHFMITAGGILNNSKQYTSIKDQYLPYNALKVAWKKCLLYNIQKWAYSNLSGDKLSELLYLINLIRNQKDKLDENKEKSRFVYCSKKATSFETVLSYIGRYLKRPVIGESRILDYNGKEVKFEYKDKYDNNKKTKTIDSIEFIGLLVQHIPNKNFKLIHYGGIFANRCKNDYLDLLNSTTITNKSKEPVNFRQRMINFTGIDPFICKCGGNFILNSIEFTLGNKPISIYFNSS